MRVTQKQLETLTELENQAKEKDTKEMTLKEYVYAFDLSVLNDSQKKFLEDVMSNTGNQKMFDWKIKECHSDKTKGDSWCNSSLGVLTEILECKNYFLENFPSELEFIKSLNEQSYNLSDFWYYVRWYLRGHKIKPLMQIYEEWKI